MSVYVDEAVHPYGRMLMCHLMADTPEELREMARKIGVKQKWIQNEGEYKEHFDICKTMRARAIANGAIAISGHELGNKLLARLKAQTPESIEFTVATEAVPDVLDKIERLIEGKRLRHT